MVIVLMVYVDAMKGGKGLLVISLITIVLMIVMAMVYVIFIPEIVLADIRSMEMIVLLLHALITVLVMDSVMNPLEYVSAIYIILVLLVILPIFHAPVIVTLQKVKDFVIRPQEHVFVNLLGLDYHARFVYALIIVQPVLKEFVMFPQENAIALKVLKGMIVLSSHVLETVLLVEINLVIVTSLRDRVLVPLDGKENFAVLFDVHLIVRAMETVMVKVNVLAVMHGVVNFVIRNNPTG